MFFKLSTFPAIFHIVKRKTSHIYPTCRGKIIFNFANPLTSPYLAIRLQTRWAFQQNFMSTELTNVITNPRKKSKFIYNGILKYGQLRLQPKFRIFFTYIENKKMYQLWKYSNHAFIRTFFPSAVQITDIWKKDAIPHIKQQ